MIVKARIINSWIDEKEILPLRPDIADRHKIDKQLLAYQQTPNGLSKLRTILNAYKKHDKEAEAILTYAQFPNIDSYFNNSSLIDADTKIGVLGEKALSPSLLNTDFNTICLDIIYTLKQKNTEFKEGIKPIESIIEINPYSYNCDRDPISHINCASQFLELLDLVSKPEIKEGITSRTITTNGRLVLRRVIEREKNVLQKDGDKHSSNKPNDLTLFFAKWIGGILFIAIVIGLILFAHNRGVDIKAIGFLKDFFHIEMNYPRVTPVKNM